MAACSRGFEAVRRCQQILAWWSAAVLGCGVFCCEVLFMELKSISCYC